jgi:hypothetical protein
MVSLWPSAKGGQLIAIAALSWYSWLGTLRCGCPRAKSPHFAYLSAVRCVNSAPYTVADRRPAERTITNGEYYVKTRRENK